MSSSQITGALTLRYGLLREPPDGDFRFRVDIDRYIEGPVEPAAVINVLEGFSDDIFSVFVETMGPAMQEWMPEKVKRDE